MPVQSFTIAEIMPQLLAGTITYVSDVYNETFGLSGMAREMPVQMEQKIRVRGKVYKRLIAGDIPEASQVPLIKDTKFTDEIFVAPEYGRGFSITVEDLIQNPDYLVAFTPINSRIDKSKAPMLIEKSRKASMECVNMIKRSEDYQVKQILETGTLDTDNYTTIDFDRDASNSTVITDANLKWKIANSSTMKPLGNFQTWSEQVATRGNSGGQEFVALMESATTYNSLINSEEWKVDSNQRRNFNIQRVQSPGTEGNINIPKGAMYRYSLLDNPAGVVHIYTYDQTYTDLNGDDQKWLDADKVYMIAADNVIQRQPVQILTFDQFMAMGSLLRRIFNALPAMKGWYMSPDWNRTTNRALVMELRKKYLTQPLTINKTFCATVNS